MNICESKIVNIFVPICLNMFGVLKRIASSDGSFEYPQHKFWLKVKKSDFLRALNLRPVNNLHFYKGAN